ncbi:palmitoyltransferase swf1 [Myotisia sp. PD_48]|nr:palmitoyltransferase swf1 [Myotisia sp. PD_48]
MPYIFLYLSVTSPSIITAENHRNHMLQYPYDRIIFHPNLVCRTCRRIKPPRSKHCSICKGCVARHDHHCVWLKTCVGRNNYRYFLALLVSLSFLLAYGAYQGCFIIDGRLQDAVNVHSPNPRSVPHWSKGLTWKIWFEFWILALADDVRIGAVALLAALTTPLAAGMLAYHIYLIWAGTTTNESSKWGDWRDDISEGVAYMAKSSEVHKIDGWDDFSEPYVAWPKKSTHTLIYNVGGEPPKLGYTFTTEQNSISQPESPNAPIDSRWTRVQNLEQVINIYDLGFWDNLREALFGR